MSGGTSFAGNASAMYSRGLDRGAIPAKLGQTRLIDDIEVQAP